MKNNILFSYTIDDVCIDVYKSNCGTGVQAEDGGIYDGVIAAVCEYLCYTQEIISPRFNCRKIDLSYDKKAIACKSYEYISKCTKEAFLNFMFRSPQNADSIVPDDILKPDVSANRIDVWCTELRRKADTANVEIKRSSDNSDTMEWIKFSYDNGLFFGRYLNKNSNYLLVSLPGYNAEWNDISVYFSGDFDILQISPLGYNTPYGFDYSKRIRGAWPVLYDTVTEIDELTGYNKWFFEAVLATTKIMRNNQKLIFIGTSQGGGASLVMSSVFNDCTVACCSEMPFLIGFSDKNFRKVRDFVRVQLKDPGKIIYNFYARERLAVADPERHTGRIKCRALIVSGEKDIECPKEDILAFYKMLNCEKKYIELFNTEHGYSEEFKSLALGWIKSSIDISEGRDQNE